MWSVAHLIGQMYLCYRPVLRITSLNEPLYFYKGGLYMETVIQSDLSVVTIYGCKKLSASLETGSTSRIYYRYWGITSLERPTSWSSSLGGHYGQVASVFTILAAIVTTTYQFIVILVWEISLMSQIWHHTVLLKMTPLRPGYKAII